MNKGFTLLEAMIVFLISVVIIGALFMTLSSGRQTWSTVDTQIALQQELRKAVSQMLSDLPESGETQISCPSDGTACTSLSFNVSNGVLGSGAINWSASPVTYALSSGQIIRTDGVTNRVLANNISNMTFARQAASSKVVQINLTAQKSDQFGRVISENVVTAVTLRN